MHCYWLQIDATLKSDAWKHAIEITNRFHMYLSLNSSLFSVLVCPKSWILSLKHFENFVSKTFKVIENFFAISWIFLSQYPRSRMQKFSVMHIYYFRTIAKIMLGRHRSVKMDKSASNTLDLFESYGTAITMDVGRRADNKKWFLYHRKFLQNWHFQEVTWIIPL